MVPHSRPYNHTTLHGHRSSSSQVKMFSHFCRITPKVRLFHITSKEESFQLWKTQVQQYGVSKTTKDGAVGDTSLLFQILQKTENPVITDSPHSSNLLKQNKRNFCLKSWKEATLTGNKVSQLIQWRKTQHSSYSERILFPW